MFKQIQEKDAASEEPLSITLISCATVYVSSTDLRSLPTREIFIIFAGKSEDMATMKYPIGIQSFQDIIEGGYNYVDKTIFVAKLIADSKYIFLSRPRRFGKSLLLSTLHAYFDGKRYLFKGLALDSADVDWTPRPVLHFDLNAENYTHPEGLFMMLDSVLNWYERLYGRSSSDVTPSQRFKALIRGMHLKKRDGK